MNSEDLADDSADELPGGDDPWGMRRLTRIRNTKRLHSAERYAEHVRDQANRLPRASDEAEATLNHAEMLERQVGSLRWQLDNPGRGAWEAPDQRPDVDGWAR